MHDNAGPELAYAQQREHNVRILASIADARHRRAVRQQVFWLAVIVVSLVTLVTWLTSDHGQAVLAWVDGANR